MMALAEGTQVKLGKTYEVRVQMKTYTCKMKVDTHKRVSTFILQVQQKSAALYFLHRRYQYIGNSLFQLFHIGKEGFVVENQGDDKG